MIHRLAVRFPLTAMISAMIVWALHFVFVYGAVGLACERPKLLGSGALWGLLIVSTVVALAMVLLVGAAAAVLWRRVNGLDGAIEQRRRFMAKVAGLLAFIALVAIVMTALPMFLQSPCIGWSPS